MATFPGSSQNVRVYDTVLSEEETAESVPEDDQEYDSDVNVDNEEPVYQTVRVYSSADLLHVDQVEEEILLQEEKEEAKQQLTPGKKQLSEGTLFSDRHITVSLEDKII